MQRRADDGALIAAAGLARFDRGGRRCYPTVKAGGNAMAFLKHLLVAVFLSVGAVATATPMPAMATTNPTAADVAELINKRIAILAQEIIDATDVLLDASSSSGEIADANELINQNGVRIVVLQGIKAGLGDVPDVSLQVLYEYFLGLVSPNGLHGPTA
jgi:hypothetical protein